ncbi:MAG: DUF393 domain-containing protein [Oscillatoriales cyanobacterium SM2_2_1]|nr:DUF393 domain-containing protein [Oscillatoriales cyanobacterium SM2_2_1]
MDNWKFKLLYDGDCPLCLKEVQFLQGRDRGAIWFVNIADPSYDPTLHGGIDYITAMSRIHGLLPDGTVLRDMAVFRQVYKAIGLGWVYGWTAWPGVRQLADWVYGLWATRRLGWTGRPNLEILSAQRCQGRCTPISVPEGR